MSKKSISLYNRLWILLWNIIHIIKRLVYSWMMRKDTANILGKLYGKWLEGKNFLKRSADWIVALLLSIKAIQYNLQMNCVSLATNWLK